MQRVAPRSRTLVALAIGAALAAPSAWAQLSVGGNVGVGAQVPNPVPAATGAVDRTVDSAMDRTRSAADRATNAAERGRQAVSDRARSTVDTARSAAQDTAQSVDAQAQVSTSAAAHSQAASRTLWTRLDTDANGSISTQEAAADATFNSGFAKADSDGDGSVTQAEYDAYARVHLSTGGMQSAPHSQAATNLTWANLDANADGKLTQTEVQANASLSGAFSTMDTDQDGAVTQAEYRSYAQANQRPSQDRPQRETPR